MAVSRTVEQCGRPIGSALLRLGAAALLSLSLSAAGPATPTSKAIAEIAKQFDTHPLIMIGERHRSRQIHVFLQAMLHDPDFICRADDIVVEFGNSRLQNLADAYANGGDFSEAELQSLWRETVPPLTWNSPVYERVYETVRAINKAHLCSHPLRILLGDTPIDWSKVNTAKDLQAFADRNGPYAEVVEREVLAKHHRALLIAGAAHAWKKLAKGTEFDEPNVAELIERRHPGLLFCILSAPSPGAADALHLTPAPSFKLVKGSSLENADFGIIGPGATATQVAAGGKKIWKIAPAKNWPRMGEVIDGLLYLGEDASLYPSPTIYLDPVYQKELLRRARIIKDFNGQDFVTEIEGLVKDANNQVKPKSQKP
jgi:hypothetical protein